MPSPLDHPPEIHALLGPTNTGKTWRAIRRMLGHRSGIIGLPLRLLAREVYDKVSAEVGEGAVALVTGEEKRVPERPRYWVCTTESMPDRPVDFVAVDEIQLIAHRERGHIFTDRLLRARGHRETWFLGADTAEELVKALVPTAQIARQPRLSRLSWGGHKALGELPPRSAIVAFSMGDVIALAEAVRRRHGGAAVVMGALSPRTRNQQVALFQSGEVPYLVATDAIGMGLNLDVEHVAFARLKKYDGVALRPLEPGELGQIAGRAGRWRRDGTFGTLEDSGELAPEQILSVEAHRFPRLRRAWWRNAEVDTSSIAALRDSLRRPPPSRLLELIPRAEDAGHLARLSQHPEVLARADHPERVALLWDICRLPDYPQTLTDHHVELLLSLWRQLTSRRGAVDPDWMAAEITPLDQPDGDIDLLVARLAAIRTWTSIAFQAAWVPDRGWQERAREIEDRLSDALHHRLVERFVDRRAMALGAGRAARVAEDGAVDSEGHALGSLVGLRFEAAAADRVTHRAARAALAEEINARVEALIAAPHEEISLSETGLVSWRGGRLGRWVAGEEPLRPGVRLDDLPLVGPGARVRVHRRLVAWSRDEVDRSFGPLIRPPESLSTPARGLVWQVAQGLGQVEVRAVEEQLLALTPRDRKELAGLDVRLGRAFVYVARLLSPEARRLRGLLWATHTGRPAPPVLDAVCSRFEGEAEAWAAVGSLRVGRWVLRVDALEATLATLRHAARRGPFTPPRAVAEALGLPLDELPALVSALGWPRRPDGRHQAR